MKIYDISQEVFGCVVFPGDPAPVKNTLRSMDKGDAINLTHFSMCAHNGTHLDAPFHFINDGKKIDELPLSKTVGYAYVADHEGTVSEDDIKAILEKAKKACPESAKRILVKGKSTLSLEASRVLAEERIDLYGNESQTVGPEDAPRATHLVLLGADVALLEGVRLSEVPEGVYLLSATPLCLGGAEGAPCRPVLIEL
ncbi:MAG: cyclase family protein [Clostridia bacterium]|nr:cyclase family protein [Clostridia bacterium]